MARSEDWPALLEELRRITGEAHARPAAEGDQVDGAQPQVVVEPGSVEEASQVLRLAHRAGLEAIPRGGATKLAWGQPPPRLDVVVSTSRLDRILEHAAGDLVVSTQAGVRLEGLQRQLATAGQRLALDPPHPGATLGGIVATNVSGPRRLRFGSPRDLLIGITVALADGTVAKAGGKVVKNVAGYDLGRLFCGSFGTLGLILEVIFRLHPVPAARRLVEFHVEGGEGAGELVQGLLHSPLVPSALELSWPAGEGGTLLALFEGVEAGVQAQAEQAAQRALLGGETRILSGEAAERVWRDSTQEVFEVGSVGVKLGFLPADLPRALAELHEIAGRSGLMPRLSAHAGSGVAFVCLPGGDGDTQERVIVELRERLGSGASVVVLEAPPELKRRVGVWGDVNSGLPLMKRVKQQFDPAGVMSPGRFVGGI